MFSLIMVFCYKKQPHMNLKSDLDPDPDPGDLAILHAIVSVNKLFKLYYHVLHYNNQAAI
jgi:hypothetical protein